MVDENRKSRNHVFNVRHKKDNFYVVVKIVKEDTEIEVEWNRWIKMTPADKENL